jgi:hypothetical protein
VHFFYSLNAGIQPLIDDQHAIAPSKVMVIDSATILTGSFNFTKAAEEKHAENLLVIKDAPELVKEYEANIRLHAGQQGGEGTPYPAWHREDGSSNTMRIAYYGKNEVLGCVHQRWRLDLYPSVSQRCDRSRAALATSSGDCVVVASH